MSWNIIIHNIQVHRRRISPHNHIIAWDQVEDADPIRHLGDKIDTAMYQLSTVTINRQFYLDSKSSGCDTCDDYLIWCRHIMLRWMPQFRNLIIKIFSTSEQQPILSNITSPTTSFFWQATQRNYFNMTKKSGNLGRSSGFFNLMEKFKFSHWNSKTPTIDLKSSNSGSAPMSALTSNHNLSSENIADPKTLDQ